MTDVVVDVDGPIGTVRLNRPERANSVTPEVVTRLGAAVREVCDTDGIRAVVLTGTGSVFCAGADVQEMHAVHTADGADGLMAYLADVWMPAVQSTVRLLWGAPKPVVAAVNGAATAGGLDFSLTCDSRVATRSARFAESYVNLGMVPVAGGAYLLPVTIGLPAATELLASGELIDAERALALGLVDELCDDQTLHPRAVARAERLAHAPEPTVTQLKRITRSRLTDQLDQALRDSYAANVELIATDGVRRRIVAIMDRYAGARA